MKKGFTIIELLLAIALFAIALPVIIGTFISAQRAQRETTAVLLANTNVSFLLEQMAREMRTGTDFGCPVAVAACPGSGSTRVAFTNPTGQRIVYQAASGQISRSVNGGTPVPVTNNALSVQRALFYVTGNARYVSGPNPDTYTSRIVISLRVRPRMNGVELPIDIRTQTAVSARFDFGFSP